jgi:hypothetical protein
MTKRERAVMLAKDVLKQLKVIGRISRGSYSSTLDSADRVELASILANDSMKEDIHKLAKHCDVCALGACFISHIGLFNNVASSAVIRKSYDNSVPCIYFDYNVMMKSLRKTFSSDNLYLIESAFEKRAVYGAGGGTDVQAAVVFGERYGDPSERLKAIMRNIIANNGRFVP